MILYERQEKWLDRVDPVTFLESHPYFGKRCRPEQRSAVWERPWMWLVILVALVTSGYIVFVGGWRIKPYVQALFTAPQALPPQPLNILPIPLASAERPAGFSAQVNEINEAISREDWFGAVEKAEEFRKTSETKLLPSARLWLYEVLVAGGMAKKEKNSSTCEEAINRYDDYKKAPDALTPSFRLEYSALQARFEKAGGRNDFSIKSTKEALETVVRRVNETRDRFGREIKGIQDGDANLRTIQVFALCRLFSHWVSVSQIKTDQNESARWTQLHDELVQWRRAAGTNQEVWSEDLLRCEVVFWSQVDRAVPFIPGWNSTVSLGGHSYPEKTADENLKNFKNILESQRPQ